MLAVNVVLGTGNCLCSAGGRRQPVKKKERPRFGRGNQESSEMSKKKLEAAAAGSEGSMQEFVAAKSTADLWSSPSAKQPERTDVH